MKTLIASWGSFDKARSGQAVCPRGASVHCSPLSGVLSSTRGRIVVPPLKPKLPN